MNLSVDEISRIISAEVTGYCELDKKFWRIEIDSRHIVYPETSIFVAINGVHHKGKDFIPGLIKKGVKVFILDESIQYQSEVTYLKVHNSLFAIQELAIAVRNSFKIPVVAITGSNGKTIIKEWLGQILSTKYSVCKNPKSFNSQLGVALSVLQLQENHEIGLFEAGISQAHEMDRLAHIIQATQGIFSNLGDAHDSGFIDRSSKLNEKLKLFETCKFFYYCGDDDFVYQQIYNQPNAKSWGFKIHNEIQIAYVDSSEAEVKIVISRNNEKKQFQIPFQDKASIENLVPCILTAIDFGISDFEIQKVLYELKGFKMRLERKDGVKGSILVNDSYSLDVNSLKLSFQFADRQSQTSERILIISDFPGGKVEDRNYSELLELIISYNFKLILTVGERIKIIHRLLPADFKNRNFESTEDLIQNLNEFNFTNSLVLVKGSRKFRFERIIDELSLSNHESILEVNLKSIAHNISVYKKYLKPETEVIAVVKAAAYGSGHYEVAKYLEHLGISILAVAYQDEAIHLRSKGIHCPIMVMNSGLSDFEKLADNNIDVVIFDNQQLRRLLEELSDDREVRIHIKLDSGMNRLGFKPDQLEECIQLLKFNKFLKVVSIFSHLSGSDSSQYKEFTNQQFILFNTMFNQLVQELNYKPKAHILNSGGIANHADKQMDMVRLGIGMYGIDSSPIIKSQLEIVHQLKTRITQIKTVNSHDKISYNLSGSLRSSGKIGVLSIGYADGLPRSAGNQYEVIVNNKKCQILGLVCMDMCMIDLSQVKDPQVGDEVEVFGKQASIEDLASKTNRIPYEILCGISSRVKRIYLEE